MGLAAHGTSPRVLIQLQSVIHITARTRLGRRIVAVYLVHCYTILLIFLVL